MFSVIKEVWNYFLVLTIASIFSFFLFFLFLNPISLNSIFKGAITSASEMGSSATVPYNPINRIAMQLDAKEKELDQRENILKEIEEGILKRNSVFYNRFLLVVLVVLVILVILVLVNFYFDYKRAEESEKKEKTGNKKKNSFF